MSGDAPELRPQIAAARGARARAAAGDLRGSHALAEGPALAPPGAALHAGLRRSPVPGLHRAARRSPLRRRPGHHRRLRHVRRHARARRRPPEGAHARRRSVRRNFGQPKPEGYRKALRLMELAARMGRPIICLIDTQGAYPGIDAEERGQAEAIAKNLEIMAGLPVPIVCAVIGEGGSGGALALGVANRILMLEYSTYSVISPEGCASILWRDDAKKPEAAEAMKMTATDLVRLGVVDEIVPEAAGGAHRDHDVTARNLGDALRRHLAALLVMSPEDAARRSLRKFRHMGAFVESGDKGAATPSRRRRVGRRGRGTTDAAGPMTAARRGAAAQHAATSTRSCSRGISARGRRRPSRRARSGSACTSREARRARGRAAVPRRARGRARDRDRPADLSAPRDARRGLRRLRRARAPRRPRAPSRRRDVAARAVVPHRGLSPGARPRRSRRRHSSCRSCAARPIRRCSSCAPRCSAARRARARASPTTSRAGTSRP